jgi:hypothetical protein
MSSLTSSTARSAKATDAARIGALLVAVLLIPRVIRMLYGEVWVEDDFYLESAWLVSVGMRPYLDFVHPHLPLLEYLAAGYLNLFGTSHLSIEILNEAVIFATSILTWYLARRISGRSAATLASILYAWSSLVFRYHMYERESFVAPLMVLGAIVALDESFAPMKQAVILALIFFIACSIKLTAVIPFGVTLVFIALAYRRIGAALACGAIFAIALGQFILQLYVLYGREFFLQTFIFHFLKGRDTARAIALFPRMLLDMLAPLLVLGCVRLFSDRVVTRGTALVLAIAGAEYAFYGVLSPTAWGHNYLEALPFIAILAGLGARDLLGPFLGRIDAAEANRANWTTSALGLVLVLICLIWVTPLVNENWLHGSVYGFGFVPRAEISQLAAALRDSSEPDDSVIAPSFICFEAARRELIRYPETYGVYRQAKTEYERDGFAAARRHLGKADFFQLIVDTSHIWTEEMRAAIASGKVTAVINDSPIQLLPLVFIPDDFLTANGFRPVLTTEHFRLWAKTPASRSTPPAAQ